MPICPRCKSFYQGTGRVCPHCSGRPHTPQELRNVAAGPTADLPAAASANVPPPLPGAPAQAGRPTVQQPARGPTPIPARIETGETMLHRTPATSPTVDFGLRPQKPPGEDPLIGQTPLGQYRIVEKLGEGGFGAVYLAEQLGVGRKAVIKVLKSRLAGSEAFAKRFQREATVLAALDHHHLVRLYNFGELDDGQLFLAMEYGGDRTLADEIKLNGRLTPERALRITEQVCAALQEAHSKRVVHRDLKPPNILIARKEGKDWVKVVDVGIAKILEGGVDDGQSTLTEEGAIAGTPAYFSPEQASGKQLDARSDLYAMGCVLYEMLSGRLPIEGRTPLDFVRGHCTVPPVALAVRGVLVPPFVREFVERALEKDANDRFQSAREMGEAAARAAERLSGAAPKQRPRVLLLVGAAAVGLLVAGVGLWQRLASRAGGGVDAGPLAGGSPDGEDSAKQAPDGGPRASSAPTPGPAPVPPPKPPDPPPPNPPKTEPQERQTHKGPRQPVEVKTGATREPLPPPDEPPKPPAAPDQWAPRLEKAAQLDRDKHFRDAIAQYEDILAAKPPDAVKGTVFHGLGVAHLNNADTREALRYFELYRRHCPPGQQQALKQQIDFLRNLGLSPTKP